jgi:predicted nucleic-acid-binding protein
MHIKYKEELFITLLALTSLFGVFLTSKEPLIPALQGTLIEPLFYADIAGNEVLFNISSGFFVSTIFYVMIVYFPEKRRKMTIQPVVNKLIENVLNKGGEVVDTMDQHAPADLKFKKNNDYSLDALKKACESIKSRQLIDLNRTLPDNINCSVGAQLNYRENIAKQQRVKVLSYLQYIDEQLVHEIDKLDNSDFCALVTSVAIPNFSPENLGFLSDATFKYHKQLETIASIYKKKINKNYSNVRYSL